MNKIKNLFIIVDKNYYKNKINIQYEKYVENLYIDKGFQIIKSYKLKEKYNPFFKCKKFKEFMNSVNKYGWIGIPDFVVGKNNKLLFFVEVKNKGDGIRNTQILFCKKFKEQKIVFYWLN